MHCPELFRCEESKGRDLMSFSQGNEGVKQRRSPAGVWTGAGTPGWLCDPISTEALCQGER